MLKNAKKTAKNA
jgi:hypothetical protein